MSQSERPKRATTRSVAVVAFVAATLTCAPAVEPAAPDRSPTIDRLLDAGGRERHERRLAESVIDGKTYPWKAYSGWGRELFRTGAVAKPPPAGGEGEPLSAFYRCVDCHNNQREDPVLTSQEPEARAWMIEHDAPAPSAEGARSLFLAPGTTLWGAVNRDCFYNDSYAIYHDLAVPGGRVMEPTSLEDAIQVCCRYCSVGRFAEPWEIDSLLAYCWDLELRLSDLGLPKPVEAVVADTLTGKDASTSEAAAMRAFLRRQYLCQANDQGTAPPKSAEVDSVGPYPDKTTFFGDPDSGGRLYDSACKHCHGENKVNEVEGEALVRDLARFHRVIANGTERLIEPYMPRFTAQRLSRQQIADIQSYLIGLK